jgi:hypothetical protein
MRQDLAVPILGQFHAWLAAERPEVLPKSPLGEAMGYALNNWEALRRYTEAGFLAIDNNVAERELKRIAIGRKNWLTVGSPRGGQTAAISSASLPPASGRASSRGRTCKTCWRACRRCRPRSSPVSYRTTGRRRVRPRR